MEMLGMSPSQRFVRAARKGDLNKMRTIYEKNPGLDINGPISERLPANALHHAIMRDDVRMVEYLTGLPGINKHKKTWVNQYSPFMIMCREQSTKCAPFMLAHNYEMNSPDYKDIHPIYALVDGGDPAKAEEIFVLWYGNITTSDDVSFHQVKQIKRAAYRALQLRYFSLHNVIADKINQWQGTTDWVAHAPYIDENMIMKFASLRAFWSYLKTFDIGSEKSFLDHVGKDVVRCVIGFGMGDGLFFKITKPVRGDFGFENGIAKTIMKFYYGHFTGPAGNVAMELLNTRRIMMDDFIKNRPHRYQIESKTLLTGEDAIRAANVMVLIFGRSVAYSYPDAYDSEIPHDFPNIVMKRPSFLEQLGFSVDSAVEDLANIEYELQNDPEVVSAITDHVQRNGNWPVQPHDLDRIFRNHKEAAKKYLNIKFYKELTWENDFLPWVRVFAGEPNATLADYGIHPVVDTPFIPTFRPTEEDLRARERNQAAAAAAKDRGEKKGEDDVLPRLFRKFMDAEKGEPTGAKDDNDIHTRLFNKFMKHAKNEHSEPTGARDDGDIHTRLFNKFMNHIENEHSEPTGARDDGDIHTRLFNKFMKHTEKERQNSEPTGARDDIRVRLFNKFMNHTKKEHSEPTGAKDDSDDDIHVRLFNKFMKLE